MDGRGMSGSHPSYGQVPVHQEQPRESMDGQANGAAPCRGGRRVSAAGTTGGLEWARFHPCSHWSLQIQSLHLQS